LPAGGWAIAGPGRSPVAIIRGEVFYLEIAGEMKLARMECRRRMDGSEERFTVQGYNLRDGLRAAFFEKRERFPMPLKRVTMSHALRRAEGM
jgi:hypothetical protein